MKPFLAIGAAMLLAAPAYAQTTPTPAPASLPSLVISSPALDAIGANLKSQIDALTTQVQALSQQVQALKTVQPGTTSGGGTPTPTPVAVACPTTIPTTTLGTATVPLYTVGAGKAFADTAAAGACLPGTGTLAAGPFVMQIDAGTFPSVFDVPPGDDGALVAGAGAGQTILDGQGGCPTPGCEPGTPKRLAWGKGVIHTRSAITVQDLTLKGGGGTDGKGDGEAGLYAEQFAKAGKLVVNRVIFTGNEDAIFAPSYEADGTPGKNVSVEVDSSDFLADNGRTTDGLSHDVYFSGDGCYSENNVVHLGNPHGNDVKVRGNCVSLSGGFYVSDAGRVLDLPDGFNGSVSIKGGTFSQAPTANTEFVGVGEESQKHGVVGTINWDGSTINVSRYATDFKIAQGVTIAFTNVKQTWSQIPGKGAPSVQVTSGGTVTGLSLAPAATDTMGPLPTPPVLASTAAH